MHRLEACFFLNLPGLLFAVSEVEEDPAFLPSVTVDDSCPSGIKPWEHPALPSKRTRPAPSFSAAPSHHSRGRLEGCPPESKPMAKLLALYRVPWMLHYTRKFRFTTKAQEEVFFSQDGEMPATFGIKNIYPLPAQGEQTTLVGHFELRSPPGQELLVNDRAVIRAEGPSVVKAESSLRARPTAPLTPQHPAGIVMLN
ncbi:hypothetical protein MG293_012075 [Ovis ammon polii]|uniref:Uncharacterized protein n=1 Tax=Ovis ammon polii TaxID=230172 RepID=A0AAD4TZV0_OVIAM|nr:hypothetical protein MG293_012075 [Ovis ammon polii]